MHRIQYRIRKFYFIEITEIELVQFLNIILSL